MSRIKAQIPETGHTEVMVWFDGFRQTKAVSDFECLQFQRIKTSRNYDITTDLNQETETEMSLKFRINSSEVTITQGREMFFICYLKQSERTAEQLAVE